MRNLQNLSETNRDKYIKKIIEQELLKNKDVLQSLKDYDEGKKEISTEVIERLFENLSKK
jgi:hypothetical protein